MALPHAAAHGLAKARASAMVLRQLRLKSVEFRKGEGRRGQIVDAHAWGRCVADILERHDALDHEAIEPAAAERALRLHIETIEAERWLAVSAAAIDRYTKELERDRRLADADAQLRLLEARAGDGQPSAATALSATSPRPASPVELSVAGLSIKAPLRMIGVAAATAIILSSVIVLDEIAGDRRARALLDRLAEARAEAAQ